MMPDEGGKIGQLARVQVLNLTSDVPKLFNETDLEPIRDKTDIIAAFFTYAQEKQKKEAAALITEEKLNEEAAKRYIQTSLKRNLFHHRLHRFSRIISSGSRWKKLLICVNLRNLW